MHRRFERTTRTLSVNFKRFWWILVGTVEFQIWFLTIFDSFLKHYWCFSKDICKTNIKFFQIGIFKPTILSFFILNLLQLIFTVNILTNNLYFLQASIERAPFLAFAVISIALLPFTGPHSQHSSKTATTRI